MVPFFRLCISLEFYREIMQLWPSGYKGALGRGGHGCPPRPKSMFESLWGFKGALGRGGHGCPPRPKSIFESPWGFKGSLLRAWGYKGALGRSAHIWKQTNRTKMYVNVHGNLQSFLVDVREVRPIAEIFKNVYHVVHFKIYSALPVPCQDRFPVNGHFTR